MVLLQPWFESRHAQFIHKALVEHLAGWCSWDWPKLRSIIELRSEERDWRDGFFCISYLQIRLVDVGKQSSMITL